MNRINESDSFNNGLLMRNLFANWPKDSLAQIFSGGNNGDKGFFGHYYGLQESDRMFGKLFYRIKQDLSTSSSKYKRSAGGKSLLNRLKRQVSNNLIKSGLYELIFRSRLSVQMVDWINNFKPEVILAQGYSLSFILLPIRIKKKFKNCRLAFLTTDDWPSYLYNGQLGENKILSYFPRRKVEKATKELIKLVDIPFAFGMPMTNEYENRYCRKFFTISHLDDPKRFLVASAIRNCSKDVFLIVTMGNFNKYRWPLLLDLNAACQEISQRGIISKITVITSSIDQDALNQITECEYIRVINDPGNDLIPNYLKGADMLFLAEGFDPDFVSAIRLSVSSKAHLFMFSKKPIVVYAHKNTGIASYASNFNWAKVITERSVVRLSQVLLEIRQNAILSKTLSTKAYNNALEMHHIGRVQKQFENRMLY